MSTPNRQSSKNLFKVSHWMTKLIGIIGFIAFVFFAFVSYNPPQIIGTVLLLLFAIWAAYLFIAYGSTEMDNQKITHISWFGVFAIQWKEVEQVKADSFGNNIVFAGKNKQLVIPGIAFWSGGDKRDMISLYTSKIEEKGIKVNNTMLAVFSISKNVKRP